MSAPVRTRSLHFEVVVQYPDGTERHLVSTVYRTWFFAAMHHVIAAGQIQWSGSQFVFPNTENIDSTLVTISTPWTVYPDAMAALPMRAGGVVCIITARDPMDSSGPVGVYFAVPAPTVDARLDCWAWTNTIEYYQVC